MIKITFACKQHYIVFSLALALASISASPTADAVPPYVKALLSFHRVTLGGTEVAARSCGRTGGSFDISLSEPAAWKTAALPNAACGVPIEATTSVYPVRLILFNTKIGAFSEPKGSKLVIELEAIGYGDLICTDGAPFTFQSGAIGFDAERRKISNFEYTISS
ncbi:hypothetical protein [uncultured Caballeronia sp.]|uniref:hypothetical protein n=1 Tax=uncultured Caballeronia sp. TaxID=1827198 RepID=UPI0035CC719E